MINVEIGYIFPLYLGYELNIQLSNQKIIWPNCAEGGHTSVICNCLILGAIWKSHYNSSAVGCTSNTQCAFTGWFLTLQFRQVYHTHSLNQIYIHASTIFIPASLFLAWYFFILIGFSDPIICLSLGKWCHSSWLLWARND